MTAPADRTALYRPYDADGHRLSAMSADGWLPAGGMHKKSMCEVRDLRILSSENSH